jgi:hypothetical protein
VSAQGEDGHANTEQVQNNKAVMNVGTQFLRCMSLIQYETIAGTWTQEWMGQGRGKLFAVIELGSRLSYAHGPKWGGGKKCGFGPTAHDYFDHRV